MMSNVDPASETADKLNDVFISFSSTNIDTARSIYDELKKRGITCWLADPNRDDIPPGENWADHLMRALKNSKIILLIFSKDSNLSKHVKNEIGIAFDNDLGILPMRIQDEKPVEGMEYFLHLIEWFNFIPPPPPADKDRLEKLIEVVRRLIRDPHPVPPPVPIPAENRSQQKTKVPFFSTWVLKPFLSWVQKIYGSIPALDGALWTYLIAFLVFFIPLALSHRMVGDYPPQSLKELFSVAHGDHFYYPDLNAILFDMVLHPAALATLVYFVLFLGAEGNQYLYNATAGFISTHNLRQARFWINIVNLLIVKILPVIMALVAFIYRRNVYIRYGMKEPLIFWASFAVALSIYSFVALSINSCYIALLLVPISETELQGEDDRKFFYEQAGMLVKLSIIFVYIILMFLIEILVEWMMADFNGTPLIDLMRWIILVFGGISIVVLASKILWLFVPEIGVHTKYLEKTFRQVNKTGLLLLIVPVALIILTIRLWLQVY